MSTATSLSPPAGYSTSQRIFNDQFTSAKLDTTKWNPWLGDNLYGRWGDRGSLPSPYSGMNYSSGAYDVQYYDPYPYGYGTNTTGAHLTGGNGHLALLARPSTRFGSLGYSWGSAAVTTYDKAYLPAAGGYVQWRAKMPDSRYGAWGSLWLLSANGAELDVQESGYPHGGANVNNILASNWHARGASQIIQNTGVDLSAGYHTYGVEYRPGQSWKVYLDGKLMATWTSNVPTHAAYQIVMDLEIAGRRTSGWHTVADPVNHPGPFELDISDVQIYSLSNPPATSLAPSNLALVSASDSGVKGDRITNIATPTITGKGKAGDTLKLFDSTRQIGTATVQSNGSWSVKTGALSNGTHTLTATQTDSSGSVSGASAPLTVTIDTAAPIVTEALAADTGSSATDRITSKPAVRGTGQASRVVTIKEGTTTLGTTTASSTGAWSFTPTGLANGAHTLTATETDLAGNTGSSTLNFTLDKTPPTVSIALASDTGRSATDRITSKPAVKGTGQASRVVTIKEGTTTLGTTMANITGAWSFTPRSLADGAHTLTATETDLAGNTGSATLHFMLDTHDLTGVA